MRQKGFFRPQYHVTMEIPYKRIDIVTVEASHRLAIEAMGTTHHFTTFGAVTAAFVKQDLEDLMATEPEEL
jgi:hypothetical protein